MSLRKIVVDLNGHKVRSYKLHGGLSLHVTSLRMQMFLFLHVMYSF